MKQKQPKPMTLDQRIQYGTTDYLELATGYLDTSPEWPGGCETLARITLPKSRLLVNKELFDFLVKQAKRTAELEKLVRVVVDDALDRAEEQVHVCDKNNDEVKARLLSPWMRALYEALKDG